MLKYAPAVFAVEKNYQIMAMVTAECLFWVKVGDKTYYDHSNGVLRSAENIHRVTLPMSELDRAGEYTVCIRPIIERKSYWSQTSDVIEKSFAFRPLPEGDFRAYHVSDAHNRIDGPIAAGKVFGDIDLLILNGDIVENSGNLEHFDTIYAIASALTGGSIPIVFSRGNHDTRGIYAEALERYCPTANGRSYYTFRMGSLWGIVLDCGEDKTDDHEEYGNTMACHGFRQEETEFIRSVVARASEEYAAEGVERRLVVIHRPFTLPCKPLYDIEKDTYGEWRRLVAEEIRPDVLIGGHFHRIEVIRPGDPSINGDHPCTIVLGGKPGSGPYTEAPWYAGCGYDFTSDGISVTFTDCEGKVLGSEKL